MTTVNTDVQKPDPKPMSDSPEAAKKALKRFVAPAQSIVVTKQPTKFKG